MKPSLAVFALVLVLAACGAEDDAGDQDATPGGTEAAGASAAPEGEPAEPTPDGTAESSPLRTASDLVSGLARRLRTGEGLDSQAWQEDAGRVAEVLWPADAEGRVPAAGRVHVQLAGIAASTARYVVRDDPEGALYLERNPEDRVVYEAFVAAIAEGPEAYRTWVEGKGAEVLATWQADRRARVLGR